MRKTLTSLLLLGGLLSADAQVKLQPMFTDNMVLQQQTDAPIWGTATAGRTVSVTTSWNKRSYSAKAAVDGRWSVRVATPKAGGPYTITISDGTPVTLKNVMIGEVWLCTGQSNMEMPVEGWGKVNNYKAEEEEANKYPNIRLLNIKHAISTTPSDTCSADGGGWQVCSAQTVAEFSAAGYFFGRNLNVNRKVPIGLIGCNWGGTYCEAWTSRDALSAMPDFKKGLERVAKLPATQEGRREYYTRQYNKWYDRMDRKDRMTSGGGWAWAEPSLTLGNEWGQMHVPGYIEENGLPYFDGIVWFRRTVDIPAAWAGKDLTLHLGPIDSEDITYVNGIEVGRHDGWQDTRVYHVPGWMVKEGKNTIAIRVRDNGSDGGIYGKPEEVYIALDGQQRISLVGTWRYRVAVDFAELGPRPLSKEETPNEPTVLFNAMIHPLVPYAVRGAIWYQGESNEDRAYQYRELLPTMIADWRHQWGTDLDFYIVQLANYRHRRDVPVESQWAEIREAQLMATSVARTGLAVAVDIGDPLDIHPKNKQEVGRRLALAARALTYGEKITYSGPIYRSHVVEDGAMRLLFDHTDGGLNTSDGAAPTGFAIAGADHVWHWGTARIDGNSVVVSSPEVKVPMAVRYAWADNPVCNLVNGAGLPASPFRTDDWPGITFRK